MSDEEKYALKDPAAEGATMFGNIEEPQGYNYVPQNPFAGLGQINPGALSSGLSVGGTTGPDYLQYDIRGRGWTEKTFFNVGTTYFLGISLGGTYGFFEGLRTSPSTKFKIRLNTVLNKMGRRGSAAGNAIGSFALIYSLSSAFYERALESDRFFDRMIPNRTISEVSTPIIAGITTGLIYKSTMGPRTMLLSGIMGAGFAVIVETTKRTFNLH